MKRFVVQELATQDQEEAVDFYTDRKDPDLAIRYLQAVQRVFSLLADKPNVGRARRALSSELQGIRWFPLASPFQKHLVFYRVERETSGSFECSTRVAT